MAAWSCAKWVGMYGTVDGQDVAASGCRADLVMKSENCNEDCQGAMRDPDFIHRRCPETCSAKGVSDVRPNGKKDMLEPLREFEGFVGPDGAAWSCAKWVGMYGRVDGQDFAASGCRMDLVMKSEMCRERCRRFMRDPDFIHSRCPETCSAKGSSGVRPNRKKDMLEPLREFEGKVGPDLAAWSCARWVGIFGTVDGRDVATSGCPADLIMKSEKCNEDCQEGGRSDPDFMHRRCPETCSTKGSSVYRPNGRDDMLEPLREFEVKLGPDVAAWSCEQWVSIYGTVDGQDVAASGCRADLVMKSENCNEDCQEGGRSDPDFIYRRCPETCSAKGAPMVPPRSSTIPPTETLLDLKNSLSDLPEPLREFEGVVGPDVAAWSCAQWVGMYGKVDGQDVAASGCPADLVMRSEKCDEVCKRSMRDPDFIHRRCPETCSAKGSSGVRPNGKVDMLEPLREFEGMVGPDVAAWSCEQVVSIYGTVDGQDVAASGCRADLIMKSENWIGLRGGVRKDPDFIHRRCPETCSAKGASRDHKSPMVSRRSSRFPPHATLLDLKNSLSDLPEPLREFEGVVGPDVAAWSCAQWVGNFGTVDGQDVAASGCRADLVMRSGKCDEGCKRSMRSDPHFVHRRCPETCTAKGASHSDYGARLVCSLIVLIALCGCVLAVFLLTPFARSPSVEASDSAIGIPLCESGVFSEFEGATPRQGGPFERLFKCMLAKLRGGDTTASSRVSARAIQLQPAIALIRPSSPWSQST
ncbi:unnamed protein product [Polarella glacialis]|uniref:Uncharacterized protein n=1 Tax=Polarella glacialis TaxID=89957 RepID=A0A813DMP1_POLGL|nr:unnamed protein product [Polarella glacialis]